MAMRYVFYVGGARALKSPKSLNEKFRRKFEKVAGGCGWAFRSRSAPILGLELSFYLVFWRVGVRNWCNSTTSGPEISDSSRENNTFGPRKPNSQSPNPDPKSQTPDPSPRSQTSDPRPGPQPRISDLRSQTPDPRPPTPRSRPQNPKP